MYFGKRDKLIVVLVFLSFLIGSILGWQVIHETVLLLFLAGIMALLVTIQIENHRGLRLQLDEQVKSYQQIESLFYLFSRLKIRHPLPPMRGWAVSPDFANIVISLIEERKPKRIVEVGSGVSTLVAAYSLQVIGEGAVISLEHEKQFCTISAINIVKHQLQDVAKVIYAPLKKVTLQGKSWLWYDTEYLQDLGTIDMLIIDGPPSSTQPLARYPALPILLPLLSDDAVVLLDDAFRSDEKRIVQLWLEQFIDFQLEKVDAEKGAAILRRQTSKSPLQEIKTSIP